ncbi:hypothetical protein G6554_21020 [Bacillus sp. MM2020_4]|nr:hypothetical protein [Bacillus sp. MM2020_4]
MNFKFIVIPNVLSLEMTHFMNRTVLLPVLTLIFLNWFIVIKAFYQRAVFIFAFILLLAGIEKLADYVGIFKHIHWRIGWSLGVWTIYILLLILIMRIFRKTLVKEVGQS